ncbi:MAG TPA: AAA family ATPase [Bacteroidales bacterium]|nr:AAA family ATPase [Bacteroidales bacterium]HOT16770.1 AAA family ATPase [Bacteroidales bacterium]
MTRLRIKDFGPIKGGCTENDGWLDIRKVTLFIGNQGSGKSTVAKLISVFSWIEKAIVKGQLKAKELKAYNRFLKQLSYQRIDNYIKSTTEIEYEGRAYRISYKRNVFTAEKNEANGYLLPKIMYVPAERNFLGAIDRPDKLKNLPSPLFTFLDEYDHARNLYSKGIDLPIGDARFVYDSLNKIAHITNDNFTLRLSEASSGFQSTVPIYLVMKYLTESLGKANDPAVKPQSIEEQRKLAREIQRIINDPAISEEVRQESLRQLSARYKPACLINIVEEPEQNLFPGSQRILLNSLLEFTNNNEGNKLIITTHSPYLINFLSIAIQGSVLYESIKESKEVTVLTKKLEDVIPVRALLKAKDVIIYQMDERSGTIAKLTDYEGIPSDSNFLNQQIHQSNVLFDTLLEIEEEI